MKKSIVILSIFLLIISITGNSCKKQTTDSGDAAPASLSNGLVAYYPFTGSANDNSGNGHNGSVVGATLTTDRFGNANSAYNFNGSGNYISIPSSSAFDLPNSLSFSVWVKATIPYTGRFISKLSEGVFPPVGWVYSIGTPNANNYNLRITVGGVQNFSTISSNPQANTWLLMTVTYDLQNVNVYINGILSYTVAQTTSTPAYLANVIIGAPTNVVTTPVTTEYFKGSLDEIRIYNRALTQTEITYLAAH